MIRHVRIENFRSIKEIDFFPRELNTLVGPNNSGKSNILRALNLILGPKWPPYSLTPEDKHHELSTGPTRITVELDTPVSKDYYGNPIDVWGFRVEEIPPGSPELFCLDKAGAEIVVGKYSNPLRADTELRSQIQAFHVDVNRDLEPELRASQWTILGRILKSIEAKLLRDATFVAEHKARADGLAAHLQHQAVTELRDTMIAELRGLSGFDSLQVSFAPPGLLGSLKSLELRVREAPDLGFELAQEMGEGLQSAIVIALARAYQKLCQGSGTPILLIEEPEVFLHPQGRRAFFELLQRIAEVEKCQTFLTTHSTEFVDITRPERLILVRKTAANGTKLIQGDPAILTPRAQDELKLACEFNGSLRESLFANAVVACEGDSELACIPVLLEKSGLSPDREGVAIVSLGSKTNLPFYLRITKHFGIPTVAAFDDDSDKVDYATVQVARNNEIVTLVGGIDKCWIASRDFEQAHRIPTGGSKPRQALDWARSLSPQQATTESADLVKAIRAARLIAAPPPATATAAPVASPPSPSVPGHP